MTAEVWLINSADRHSPAILPAPSVTLSERTHAEFCMLPIQAPVPGSNLHVKFCHRQGVIPFVSSPLPRPKRAAQPSGLPSQASGLFRSFTGESLCPWNEVTQLAGGHRRLL